MVMKGTFQQNCINYSRDGYYLRKYGTQHRITPNSHELGLPVLKPRVFNFVLIKL